jgi:hypothetical protein
MNCKILETSRKICEIVRDEIAEQFRKLHNEEVRDWYRPANTAGAEVAQAV